MVLDKRSRRAIYAALAGLTATALSFVAEAHERFVPHDLKTPMRHCFFVQRNYFQGADEQLSHDCNMVWQGSWPMGVNPKLLNISLRVFAIMTVFMVIWYLRQPVQEFVERRIVRKLGGRVQEAAHQLACFLTDRPVNAKWFQVWREWSLAFFVRSPALVLMYSATNDSLVMPSYPLDPHNAEFFKFAQVLLGILILTQTALPLCGALVFGTWLYLFNWGWMVAVDALPVLTVAVIYVFAPWQSHKIAITEVNKEQMRILRIVLGFGFLALGYLKLYNYQLTAGVADQFPSTMEDPMVTMLMMGFEEGFQRETWVVAFGLAEIMSGFLVMVGVFTRVWAAIMTFMFTKLMLVDFGWEEIPHLYPIAAMLTVITSNKLSSEFDYIEALEEKLGRAGKSIKQAGVIIAASVAVAAVVIFPLLYFITTLDRRGIN